MYHINRTLFIVFSLLFVNLSIGCENPNCKKCKKDRWVHCDTCDVFIEKMAKEQYVELKEKIIAVQNENGGKFTVLLWGIGLILPTIAVIVAFTIYNNVTNAAKIAKETSKNEFSTAKTEFLREYRAYRIKSISMFKEVENKKSEIETLKSNIETLIFNFEQYQEMVKKANVESGSIKVQGNEDGNNK